MEFINVSINFLMFLFGKVGYLLKSAMNEKYLGIGLLPLLFVVNFSSIIRRELEKFANRLI